MLVSLASRVRGVDLLLFHDRDDAEVPWDNGASLARSWPGAVLVTTDGLGHHRIAREPSVVAAAVQFMAAGIGHPGAAAGELWLNQELFERERRQRLIGA